MSETRLFFLCHFVSILCIHARMPAVAGCLIPDDDRSRYVHDNALLPHGGRIRLHHVHAHDVRTGYPGHSQDCR